MRISAILWDYDGTIVDTTRKNMDVTVEVLKNFIDDIHNNMPKSLTSVENYKEACSINIKNTLNKFKVAEYFDSIIGYEDISYNEQKPNPNGFLKCIESLKISIDNSIIIYIGDHQEDTIFGKNVQEYYNENGYKVKIICIAASYSGHNTDNWTIKPDFIAHSTNDILDIIKKL